MKITYLPNDMDAPGFYRCLSPGRQLSEHGHDVRLPPHTHREQGERLLTVFEVETKKQDSDLWVLQIRRERYWAESGVQDLREAGSAVICDVDDNYEELPDWNPAFYGTHPYVRDDGVIVNREARRAAERSSKIKGLSKMPNKSNRLYMREIFKQADALTVSTPYLGDLYRPYNGNVHVVRNYVDWDIWKTITPQYKVERPRLRIGYLGVFRFRRGDLEVIKDVIPKFMARHPEVDFVANTEAVHDFLGVPAAQRVTVGEWHFFPRDGGRYPLGRKTAVLDIGLVPLTAGGLAEGKSHLKGMEYNAAGIPFIASNTESYRYWCDNTNGRIVEDPKHWEDWLEFMVTDDDSRRGLGEGGRHKARAHSIQNHWGDWERVYQGVVGDEATAIARGAIKHGAVQKVSELAELLRMGLKMKPRVVVEVGSARGGTFWALAQVAAPNALLVSIDIPAGSPIDVRGGKDVYLGRDRERMRSYVREGQRCVLIDGDSQTTATLNRLLDTLHAQKIDLLLIDADHRYDGVKRDYELYSPLVREGGIIAFHDVIAQNDSRSGVHLLWEELERKHATTHKWVGADNWGMGTWGGVGVVLAGS